MTKIEMIISIIWWVIGFFGMLTIMIREEGWTFKESTIGDILSLTIIPCFGVMIWMFYGFYLLATSDIWNIKLFKKKKRERN